MPNPSASPDLIIMLCHGYFIAAIGYNVVSQVWGDLFGRKFSATDPSNGVLIISVIYTIFLLDGAIDASARMFMLLVFMGLIARFGVFKHLGTIDQTAYLSPFTRVLAMAINVFGVLVLAGHLYGHLSGQLLGDLAAQVPGQPI